MNGVNIILKAEIIQRVFSIFPFQFQWMEGDVKNPRAFCNYIAHKLVQLLLIIHHWKASFSVDQPSTPTACVYPTHLPPCFFLHRERSPTISLFWILSQFFLLFFRPIYNHEHFFRVVYNICSMCSSAHSVAFRSTMDNRTHHRSFALQYRVYDQPYRVLL